MATVEELLTDFITASRQAKYDAQTEDLEELRNWHRKSGSNLSLAAGILSHGGGSGAACLRAGTHRQADG